MGTREEQNILSSDFKNGPLIGHKVHRQHSQNFNKDIGSEESTNMCPDSSKHIRLFNKTRMWQHMDELHLTYVLAMQYNEW